MANPTWEETTPVIEETTPVPQLQEDVGYTPEAHNYSAAESAGLSLRGTPTGLPQGIALGFADELGALSGTLGAKTGGDPRSFGDIYSNIRDVLRQEGEQATEQHPIAALGGELLGGLAVPIGAESAAAKATLNAEKIGAAKALLKSGKTANQLRVSRELGKIGEVAKTGAKAGAIAGLGTSTADLTTGEPDEYVKAAEDVATGATVGAGTGGLLQTGGALTKAGIGAIKSLPHVEAVLRTKELVDQGYSLVGNARNISKEAREHAREILDKLDTLRTFTGTLFGKAKQEASDIIGPIKIDKAFDNVRNEINNLKPIGAAEKEDVEALKQALSDILEETEKTHYRYERAGLNAEEKAGQRAGQKVAKKTAEAEAKDMIKIQELQAALQEAAGDTDVEAKIFEKLNKLKRETSYPPETINEELTGLPVLGVPRGEMKTPIVEAIPQEIPGDFSPIKWLEGRKETVQGRTAATPGEMVGFRKSVSDVPTQTGLGQHAKGMINRTLQDLESQAAESAGEKGKNALELLKAAAEGHGTIKEFQKSIGLPESGSMGLSASDEQKVAEGVQRAILGLESSHGSPTSRDTFFENMDRLIEQFPQIGSDLKNMANNISDRYRISKGMTAGGIDAAARGGLSKPALTTRATEFGTIGLNVAKEGIRDTAKATKNEVLKLGQRVHEASPEQLQKLMEMAAQKGTAFGQNTAKVLGQILTAPMAKRRALLFTLMQQPGFRDFAKGLFESEPEQ